MNCHSDSPFLPRAIALIGKFFSPEIAEPLSRLAESLHERGATVFVERGTAEQVGREVDLSRWTTCDFEDIGAHADLAIVLGGDGTMLSAARQLARHGVPLLGVNQGRLGFLTDIGRHHMLDYLDGLFSGQFKLESRMLLAADVLRAGEVIASNIALNDVVVDKGAIGRMIELELSIDGEFIYNLRADGLILSTPTGSTAYSLSAGGPIVHPASGTIALVPMSPHSLTNRPILVDGRAEIAVRITSTTEPRVHFDGQATLDLHQDDVVRLKRGEHDICLLHPPDYSYFAMLRQKLHWSERPHSH